VVFGLGAMLIGRAAGAIAAHLGLRLRGRRVLVRVLRDDLIRFHVNLPSAISIGIVD
jgi:hypothetical protein